MVQEYVLLLYDHEYIVFIYKLLDRRGLMRRCLELIEPFHPIEFHQKSQIQRALDIEDILILAVKLGL